MVSGALVFIFMTPLLSSVPILNKFTAILNAEEAYKASINFSFVPIVFVFFILSVSLYLFFF